MTISRTGYTGDLGYEVRVGADDALAVLDAVIEAGEGHGFRPFGEEALLMTRIEAGLVLINVEFSSSRFAFTDHDRVTPKELGFGWMLQGHRRRRPPVHRPQRHPPRARRQDLALGERRAGRRLADYNRLYTEAGLIPPKDETPLDYESMLYDDDGERIGYATSLMYSPVLQRHIAMARVRPDLARRRVAGQPRAHHQPRVPDGRRRRGPAAPVQPRRERRPDTMATRQTKNYDAIIVGGGHNGLVNGAYLAKAGPEDAHHRAPRTSSAARRSPRSCAPASTSRRSRTR